MSFWSQSIRVAIGCALRGLKLRPDVLLVRDGGPGIDVAARPLVRLNCNLTAWLLGVVCGRGLSSSTGGTFATVSHLTIPSWWTGVPEKTAFLRNDDRLVWDEPVVHSDAPDPHSPSVVVRCWVGPNGDEGGGGAVPSALRVVVPLVGC